MWRITGYSNVMPLAPSTLRAVLATSLAMATLSILPKLTCGVANVPASFRRPRWMATSVPRCTATIISTSLRWVSWNDEIGRLNCTRSPA